MTVTSNDTTLSAILNEEPDLSNFINIYPNPSSGDIKVDFHLVSSGHVTLLVYDLLGNQVRLLSDDLYPEGMYRVFWDGRDNFKNRVTDGIYLVTFIVDGRQAYTRKIIVSR